MALVIVVSQAALMIGFVWLAAGCRRRLEAVRTESADLRSRLAAFQGFTNDALDLLARAVISKAHPERVTPASADATGASLPGLAPSDRTSAPRASGEVRSPLPPPRAATSVDPLPGLAPGSSWGAAPGPVPDEILLTRATAVPANDLGDDDEGEPVTRVFALPPERPGSPGPAGPGGAGRQRTA